MQTYHKINTLFKREMFGKDNCIIPDEPASDLFYALRNIEWEFTEKVDGTNIRIEISHDENHEGYAIVNIGGRTDKADIPAHLKAKLEKLFCNDKANDYICRFPNVHHVTLYGEGYGAKIQGCGGDYIKDGVDFILFDVQVDDKIYLTRENVELVAAEFDLQTVPVLGTGTIIEAISWVKAGFKSHLNCSNPNLMAEGLVIRPKTELLDRLGNRVITKVKSKDFRQYINKYNDDMLNEKLLKWQ